MLEISGLNQFYGESHILRDVELQIADASCTCLMGRNGVGKTTLLKSIMGLLRVRSGPHAEDPPRLWRRRAGPPETSAHSLGSEP